MIIKAYQCRAARGSRRGGLHTVFMSAALCAALAVSGHAQVRSFMAADGEISRFAELLMKRIFLFESHSIRPSNVRNANNSYVSFSKLSEVTSETIGFKMVSLISINLKSSN